VTQAHIHIGQPGVNGGIVLFLCTNLTPPAGVPLPPACPNAPEQNVVTGTLTAANVITATAQGIAAGEFSEVIDAMKAQVSYANVHSVLFPGGEIRGQITHWPDGGPSFGLPKPLDILRELLEAEDSSYGQGVTESARLRAPREATPSHAVTAGFA
jgi:hypothetical protein